MLFSFSVVIWCGQGVLLGRGITTHRPRGSAVSTATADLVLLYCYRGGWVFACWFGWVALRLQRQMLLGGFCGPQSYSQWCLFISGYSACAPTIGVFVADDVRVINN